MVRKIFKTGNSIVISLPKEISDALELGEGSEVTVELDPIRRQIVIAPLKISLTDVDTIFAKQVAEFIEAYRPALEALAR
jgi:antitoxin MazE